MTRLRVEPRTSAPLSLHVAAFAVPVAATALLGSLVFLSFSISPLAGLHAFFVAPVSSAHGLSELLVKAAPLTLIGCGLALAFRSNTWNIGAEGQFTLGAIAGCGVALFAPWQDSALMLPAMILAALAAGAFWAGIVAWLRTRFAANEILSSLMLVYVAQFLLLWLVQGPWRDPDGFNFPETRLLQDAATLSPLLPGTRLHSGVLFVLPAAVCLWLILYRSLFGFQLRVVGAAPRAARFAGFSRARIIWLTLCLGGALAGLAGTLEVSGVIGQLVPRISPGYGFTAIIVAFLGGLHPLGVVAAALLVALTYLGAETAQILLGLPHAAAGIFQGLLLFTVLGGGFLRRYRVRVIPRADTATAGTAGTTNTAPSLSSSSSTITGTTKTAPSLSPSSSTTTAPSLSSSTITETTKTAPSLSSSSSSSTTAGTTKTVTKTETGDG